MTRLTAVSTADIPEPSQEPHPGAGMQEAAITMMAMALKALSQRAIVAIANLFTLLTTASAFYLWLAALPEINTLKIAALTIYSMFILAINIYGRRK